MRAINFLTFKALAPTLGGPVPGPDRDPASPPLEEFEESSNVPGKYPTLQLVLLRFLVLR